MPSRASRFFSLVVLCILPPVVAATLAGGAFAEEPARKVSPFQVSLVPPAQVVPKEVAVLGARFNILYGVQDIVWGVDFGPYNETRTEFRGLGLGAVNVSQGNAIGAHVALGNSTVGNFIGLQASWFNQTDGDLKGLQAGFASFAREVVGLQIGVVNVTDSLRGVQFGVININRTGRLKFFPIMNVGF
jgi:hypothetical protein